MFLTRVILAIIGAGIATGFLAVLWASRGNGWQALLILICAGPAVIGIALFAIRPLFVFHLQGCLQPVCAVIALTTLAFAAGPPIKRRFNR